jgi:hypothetical protein
MPVSNRKGNIGISCKRRVVVEANRLLRHGRHVVRVRRRTGSDGKKDVGTAARIEDG